MDPIAMCQRTLEGAERMVASLRPDELSKPTPCSEWNVRQLVEHMTGVNWAFAGAAGGQRPEGGSSDHGAGAGSSGEDVAGAYAASARAALAAWRAPGMLERTLTLPFGQMPGAQAIGFNIGDQLVHTWDLAKATGRDRALDPEACEMVLERTRQFLTPEARGPGRPFGPERPCPENAQLPDRLAAFLGRAV
jgi:uncharacterized protein (TIGR03086 family)